MDHVDKYFWVINHPKIGAKNVQGSIELTPQKVNPINCTIEETDDTLNTKYEWWVEFSKLDKISDGIETHYWELDCGGDTAEEAVDNLYNLVKAKYGEY